MLSRLSYLRASFRIALFLIGTIALIPFQVIWILPNFLIGRLPRYQSPVTIFWFHYILWLFGIRVKLVNKRNRTKKQKIYLSNHISYIDILVHGAYFNGFFIAKSDIASWPIFGFLSRITGTLFIKRNRRYLNIQIALLKKHLNARQSLILFPEGTTGNGRELLHFKSALLNVLSEVKKKPALQPVSIRYTHIDDKPLVTQENHDRIAWYADMVLAPHLLQLLRHKSVTVQVTIHPSIHVSDQFDPKALMMEVESTIRSDFA